MDTKPRRIARWKIIAAILGVLAIAVGVSDLWVNAIGNRRQLLAEEGLAALRQEVRDLDLERVRLRKGMEPGNAWDDYLLACAEAGTIKELDPLSRFGVPEETVLERAGSAFLQSHASIVDHLSHGADRIECRYPDPKGRPASKLGHFETVVDFSLVTARSLAGQGKMRESLDVLFSLCQFSCDLGSTAEWHWEYPSLISLDRGLKEIRDLLLSRSTSREVCELIDKRLSTLDEALPRHARALLLKAIRDDTTEHERLPLQHRLQAWRFGWSLRILKAEAMVRSNFYARRLADSELWPWGQAKVEDQRLISEWVSHYEPALIWFGWSLDSAPTDGRFGRYIRTHLRLLQAAAHFRATGDIQPKEDPFGGKILSSIHGNRVKLWSVGVNAVDDGGQGEWNWTEGKDIVLEVER